MEEAHFECLSNTTFLVLVGLPP